MVEGVLSNGGSARHVFVRRVGARADETDLELRRPVVRSDGFFEFANGSSKIRREWAVDVGLEFGQVDFDELVVLGTFVLLQVLRVRPGEVTNGFAVGSASVTDQPCAYCLRCPFCCLRQITVHVFVEWEQGGSCTDLGAHVAYGTHASGGERVDTGS